MSDAATPNGKPDEDEIGDQTTASVPEVTDTPTGPAGPERVYTKDEVDEMLGAKEAELQDRFLRLASEYQNYRRRAEKDRETERDDAVSRLVTDLLPVIDSFEKALALRDDPAAAVSGLDAMDRLLRAALAKHGIEAVDPAGKPFDPKVAEAIAHVPGSKSAPGTVIDVMDKGWLLRQRLLRPARVAVAAAPEKK